MSQRESFRQWNTGLTDILIIINLQQFENCYILYIVVNKIQKQKYKQKSPNYDGTIIILVIQPHSHT